jgi:integrase
VRVKPANPKNLEAEARELLLENEIPLKSQKPKDWKRGMGNVAFGKQYGAKPWRARYLREGKAHYRYFATEQEAWSFLKSEYRAPIDRATVAGLLQTWFKALPAKLSQRTVVGYRDDIDHYLTPGLGSIPARNLTTAQALLFFKSIKGYRDHKKVSDSTVMHVFTTLRSAYSFAMETGMVATNPFLNGFAKTMAKHFQPSKDYESFTQDELKQILAALDQEKPVVNAFFRMAAMHGLRIPGEARGLRWQDYNPETGVIALWGQLGENAKPGDLKTDSERQIALHPQIRELLGQVDHHKGEWGAYIFLYPKGHDFAGKPFGYTFVRETFRRIVEKAGVPLRGRKKDRSPHSFRHTVLELLAAQGTSMSGLMDTSGHKSPSMVTRYIKRGTRNALVEQANRQLFG